MITKSVFSQSNACNLPFKGFSWCARVPVSVPSCLVINQDDRVNYCRMNERMCVCTVICATEFKYKNKITLIKTFYMVYDIIMESVICWVSLSSILFLKIIDT